jgi:hypothetical protein
MKAYLFSLATLIALFGGKFGSTGFFTGGS